MTVADVFDGEKFPRVSVQREEYDSGECRRFHLLFFYRVPGRQNVASGEQVLFAPDIAQAAVRIASERGVSSVHIQKRFFSGRPASSAEKIDTVFDIIPLGGPHA